MKFPAALLLLIAAAPSLGQQASQVLWWGGSWEAAFAEAKVRNVPLLVVFIQDGEEANERLATSILRDPAYVKATQKTVAVLANRENHGSAKSEVGGTTKAVCAKYGSTTCQAHQNIESPARVELCGNEVQTPQHVLVLPDRKVVARIVDIAPVSAYQELIGKGIKKLGKGLTSDELKQIRDQLREAGVRIELEDWPAALQILGQALPVARDTPFAKEVEAVIAKIDAEGMKRLEQAKEAEKSGDALLAVRTLESAVEAFAGTACVAPLKKELNRIKGTKAGVEASRVLAKEKRAQPAFEAGAAAEKAKDFIKARREYERAIATAPGTLLAERAGARIAALGADPDIKLLFEREDREVKARDLLKEAEKLVAAGMKDAARDALRRIAAEYSDTAAGTAAKSRLEELR